MKKLFVFMFVFLFAISFASALTFDNVKSYDSDKREVTITNSFGFGEQLVKAKLLTPLIVPVIPGKDRKVAEIEIINTADSWDYSDLFTKMSFQDLNYDRDITREFVYKLRVQTGTKNQPIFESECSKVVGKNGSQELSCEKTQVGSKFIPVYTWEEITLDSFSSLSKGNFVIGIFTDVHEGDYVDWIPTFFGKEVEEWSAWTDSLNEKIISYWTLNESTGTNGKDSIDGKFNLTLHNNWTAGIIGNGQFYDTSKSRTPVPFNWSILGSNASINMWVNATSSFPAVTDRLVVNREDGGLDGFDVSIGTSSFQVFYNNIAIDAGTTYTDDVWFMFTMTFNDTDVFVYMNGTKVSNKSITSSDWAPTAFCIGDQGAAVLCTGSTDRLGFTVLDEISVWNRTLTPDEATQLYNNGSAITFVSDAGNFTTTLDFPADKITTLNKTQTFNATINISGSSVVKNATLLIWHSNGTLNATFFKTISGLSNQTTFLDITLPLGNLTWNVKAEGDLVNGSVLTAEGINRTISRSYIFNSENHSQLVGENGNQNFTLNVTLASGLASSDGVLIYNNTRFPATKVTAGSDTIYTRTIITPDINANVNVSWLWELDLNDGSSGVVFNITNGTQEVQVLSIDDCSVQPVIILNLTLRDEDNQVILNATSNNSVVDLFANFSNPGGSTTFSQSYNSTNPIQLCISTGLINNTEYTLDAIISYDTDAHVLEFHNIQNTIINLATVPKNINLFDLATDRSQEFLFTVKDTDFLPITDSLITIKRKYISEGVSKAVEVPKTDSLGQTLGHLVLGDVIYNFEVSKNGKLLGTFENKKAVCEDQATGDCKINLNLFSTSKGGTDFQTFRNVAYTFEFNDTSRTSTVTFNTLDGTSALGLLNVTRWPDQNTTLCSNSLSSSAGTISCTIPESFGNVTGQATFYINVQFVDSQFVTIKQNASEVFGGSRVILMFLMFVTLSLMAISSPMGIVIFGIFGMGLGVVLVIIEGGTLVGVGSTILWFVIAGGILVWKINQRR